jgi:MYXO-CTERM domain-containing protein
VDPPTGCSVAASSTPTDATAALALPALILLGLTRRRRRLRARDAPQSLGYSTSARASSPRASRSALARRW